MSGQSDFQIIMEKNGFKDLSIKLVCRLAMPIPHLSLKIKVLSIYVIFFK